MPRLNSSLFKIDWTACMDGQRGGEIERRPRDPIPCIANGRSVGRSVGGRLISLSLIFSRQSAPHAGHLTADTDRDSYID